MSVENYEKHAVQPHNFNITKTSTRKCKLKLQMCDADDKA